MIEKRTSSTPSGPKSGGAAKGMAPPPDERNSVTDADYLRLPKSSSPILKRSRSFNSLAIQLSIDPRVKSIRYLDSLAAMERRVPVEMLVAEHDNGQYYAYDLVHERPTRDLDTEGLVLLALEANDIRLVEVDQNWIDAEPRASNSLMIWKNRCHLVDDSARDAIVRTVRKQGPIAIRKLAEIAQISYPLESVCALAWEGILSVDLSEQQLDLDAEISLAKSIDRRQAANSTPPSSIRGP